MLPNSVLKRHDLAFALCEVEGQAVRLGEHAGEEHYEPQGLLEDEPVGQDSPKGRAGLCPDDLGGIVAANAHEDRDHGQAHADLVADHGG